jgi:hypothetical protein
MRTFINEDFGSMTLALGPYCSKAAVKVKDGIGGKDGVE